MSAVTKHWVVAAFTIGPPEAIGTVESTLHATLPEANERAKELAALTPGQHYVVYEAQWYAHVDSTPVALNRVEAI